MRRILLIFSTTLLTTFSLAACGDTDENIQSEEQEIINNKEETDETKQPNTSEDTEPAITNDQADMKQKVEELDYNEFELEVDYADNKEYEAKIDYENDQITAELEDEITNVEIEGKDAFDAIFPNVQSLTIKQDTKKEDAIQQILETFDLDSDYVEFELEITFNDNTKIEFKDKK